MPSILLLDDVEMQIIRLLITDALNLVFLIEKIQQLDKVGDR